MYEPWGSNPEFPVLCENGCGFRWKTIAKRKVTLQKKRHSYCWFDREALMPPLKTGQNPDEEPVGLLFTAKYRGKNITDYPEFQFSVVFTGVVVGKDQAYNLTRDPVPLENGFWNHCKQLRYRSLHLSRHPNETTIWVKNK